MNTTTNNTNDEEHSKVSELSVHNNYDDDAVSSNGSTTATSLTNNGTNKAKVDAETKCFHRSRFVVLFLVLAMGAMASGVTWYFTNKNNIDDFELQVETLSIELDNATHVQMRQLQTTMTAMASSISGYAETTFYAWPLETLPNFELLASSYRHVTPLRWLATSSVVALAQKETWQDYSVANQDWILQSYQAIGLDDIQPLPIPPVIYNLDPVTGYTFEATDEPYFLPLWQISEPPKDTQVVNYNLLSNSIVRKSFELLFRQGKSAVLTQTLQVNPVLGLGNTTQENDDLPPESIWMQPIYDNVMDITKSNPPTMVGAIVGVLSWQEFFTNLVRSGNQGMVVVLQDDCGGSSSASLQEYTFEINGPQAIYLGKGDLHNPKYNEYAYTTTLQVSNNQGSIQATRTRRRQVKVEDDVALEDQDYYCDCTLVMYPSTKLVNQHVTNAPAIYTSVMVILFVLAAIGFIGYDYMVQKRQREVLKSAARSNAIVSSLFPAEIRDRLFKGDNGGDVDPTNIQNMVNVKDNHYHHHSSKYKSQQELLAGAVHPTAAAAAMSTETQKFRLKNYLSEDVGTAENKETIQGDTEIQETKPIADLFPSTTVLFADIAGFTAWSSVREPSQVFTLLETVYKAFDKTAKRRKVFKVETVGDCYVAVTGLPEPLKDHAVVMCRFARECLTQFNQLAGQLEVLLGPDTGDLAIRVGIHSGPVTAGVLRGDKSRFQLFGDTVNTAARIESTGTRNRIHLSHETAELIFQAGKHNWLRKRTETVMAKGKGEMQTYWLLTDEELASGTNAEELGKGAAPLPIVKANAARIGTGNLDMMDPESTLPPRVKRLVDWNVDVLKRLLKQIVARRNAMASEQYDLNHPLMMKTEVNIGCDTYVLDEVTEIIRLPGYTAAVKVQENPNKIALPKEVEDQLRLYVASIAAMHRDNPFHNFEHASHVMMSVSKLLSRIVAPDEVLKNENDQDHLTLSLHDHTYGITSDPLTQFSVVLAALIHDVDHSGVSNFQLIKENAKIAKVFKNKSVAEQNSIVLAWDRLMESRFAALRSYIYADPEELKRFRQLMVNTVLATDIFDKELQTLRKNRWDKAFQHNPTLDTEDAAALSSNPEDDINRKATIVIEHLIQASDVAHTMQHWHIYQKWNERLFHEMTVAFQSNRMEKNPADGWYQGELGFFDNYVIPLAKKLKECGVFGVSSDEYLNYALENRREWSSKGEEAVKRMVEKYQKKSSDEDEKANTNNNHNHNKEEEKK